MNKPKNIQNFKRKLDDFLAVKSNFRALVVGLIGVWLLAMIVLVLVFLNMSGMIELISHQPEPTQLVLSLPTSEFTPIPPPDPNAVEAEIGLLGYSASADHTALQVQVSIYNYNTTEFTFTKNDVRIFPEGGEVTFTTDAKPVLPYVIKPGETKKFSFSFPMPSENTVVFQIFTAEYDLSGLSE